MTVDDEITTPSQESSKMAALPARSDTVRRPKRWTSNWADLVAETVSTDMCSGCASCVVACPKNVLSLDAAWHPTLSRSAWHEESASQCSHGERGCTLCTRACPRFRAWEPQADTQLHGRPRDPEIPEEVAGIAQRLTLLQATDPDVGTQAQDGGFVSALLIYCFDQDLIDAALVSYVDDQWNARAGVAWNRDDVLAAAGSRYTFSANLTAYQDAVEKGAERIALVGMGCQTSAAPTMMARGVRKAARRIVLNVGLLCSKTFSETFLDALLRDRYGLERGDVVSMDIKGVLQLGLRPGINDDDYLEIPLKECHSFTRVGCASCPDFSAEHADVSVGGIGAFDNRSLAIIRTEMGERLVSEMVEAGLLQATEADSKAIKLLRILSTSSRKRWPIKPDTGAPPEHVAPGLIPVKN